MEKLQCIVQCKKDIIFLSDLRLNSLVQKSAVENISKKFRFNGYDFFHNALTSNRGVGILISCKLNAAVLRSESDIEGNFLLMDLNIKDTVFTIGSIYGPNVN